MATVLFGFEDYKDYLKAKIAENAERTGYKAALARAADVPQALISQVLHGKTNLSLDHALKLARFWHLDDTETEHWLELVQLARAASPELRRHLRDRLAARQRRQEDISVRLSQPRLAENDQEWDYYTHWMLQAIHMLVTIPGFQTPKPIAAALHAPVALVQNRLRQLETMGVVSLVDGTSWRATQKRVHLPKSSRVSPVNHWMWRQKAMESIYSRKESDLFYSTLHTLSVEDARRLRELILELIDRASAIVAPSKEETLIGLNIDFFSLIG